MLQPKNIFIFNSSLPEGTKPKDVLHYMGTSNPKFRGQNIGNTYISFGLLKCLFGNVAKVDHCSNIWDTPLSEELIEKINSQYDNFIFILQDYIRESTESLIDERIANFIEKINIPITSFSLCANSFNGFDIGIGNKISNGKKRLLKVLSEKTKSIGVRGEYSAEVLKTIGINNVKVVGCPSYFENGKNRFIQKKIWNPEKVVTTATFFNKNLPNTSHILQDELYFINLLYMGGNSLPKESNITSKSFNIDEIPTSLQLLLKGMRGQLEFFSDLNSWREFYQRNDFCLTIGTRLHSGIFSINSGVPAIVTNPDSRARETCEYLNIPYNPSIGSSSNIEEIYSELDISKINSTYSERYQVFLDYLIEHNLAPNHEHSERETIIFPKLEKSDLSQALPQFYSAFTELSKSIEREMITINTFGGEKVSRAKKLLRKIISINTNLSAEEYYQYLTRAFGKK